MFVEAQERVGRDTRIYDILAIVACIVPALGTIDGTTSPCRGTMERNSLVGVARGALPLARIRLFERHGGSLVVEKLKKALGDGIKCLVLYLQVLANFLTIHLDAVCPRSLKFGEIHELNALTAAGPCGRRRRRDRKDSLAGFVDKLDVPAPLEQGQFLEIVGMVANLVDVGRGGAREAGQGEDSGDS